MGIAVTQQHKEAELQRYFIDHLGSNARREFGINWANLRYQTSDLSNLEEPIEEQGIHDTIMEMPFEKSLGPHGFIGLFYTKCWTIIKEDLTAAIKDFFI